MFKRFFEARRIESDAQAHRRGYEWAAGVMLKGRDPDTIAYALKMQEWDHDHPFDAGIEAATADWRRRFPIGKNPTQ